MSVSMLELGFGYCGPCGNYVPTVEAEGDVFCQYCYSDYPEFAEPVR